MKRSVEILSGIATVVFLNSLVVWIFCFSKVNNDYTDMDIRWPFMCAAAVGFFLVDLFLVHKGITLTIYLLIQILMTAAGVWLCLSGLYLEPFKTRTVVITCILYGVSILAGAYIAHEHVQENGMLIRFDLAAFMIIILLILEKWVVFPCRTQALTICLISLGISLAAIIASRAGRFGSSSRHVQGSVLSGRAMIGLGIIAVLVLTGLIYFLLARSMEQGAFAAAGFLGLVWSGIKAAVIWLYQTIYRFLMWLLSGFSQEEVSVEMLPEDSFSMDISEMETGEITVPVWFYLIIGVIIAALIAFVLIRIRRIRFRKIRFTAENQESLRRESHLRQAFSSLLKHLKERILFHIHAFRYRNSIPGVLLWCERHTPKKISRRKCESGQEFLRRIALCTRCGEGRQELLDLADMTERYYYAPGGSEEKLSASFIKTIRKKVRNLDIQITDDKSRTLSE